MADQIKEYLGELQEVNKHRSLDVLRHTRGENELITPFPYPYRMSATSEGKLTRRRGYSSAGREPAAGETLLYLLIIRAYVPAK